MVFDSISDVVNQNLIISARNTKTDSSFLEQNYDKQFENATNEKPFNQLVSSKQKLILSDINLMNTNPFSYFEKSN